MEIQISRKLEGFKMSTGKDLAVGLMATATETEIVLHFGKPGSYRIYRKASQDSEWGSPLWNDRALGLEFVDTNVVAGQSYEYKVVEVMTSAVAYVLSGFQVPLVANRGKLILIVEQTHAGALANELTRFEKDLTADGYSVVRRDVSKFWSPDQLKALIKDTYLIDPDHTNTAILFGECPVRLSGPENYDGHGAVMVASDGFYADMSGADWSGNPSVFPAKLRLALGRIDFSGLTCYQNKPNNPRSEVDLLRSYLNRNHAWRNGQWSVTRRAAIRDGFGPTPEDPSGGRDFSSNGWRNFPQMVGNAIDEIPDGQFFSTLRDKDYLICMACGGGQKTSMAGTGGTTSGSDDFALNNIQCPFVMLLGSAMLGQWNSESGFVRSCLASGDDERGCLVAFGAGAPHVFLHRFAAGGPIGESFLLSQNNFTVYEPTGNVEDGLYSPSQSTGIPSCSGRVHQSLHGDPTLVIAPKRNQSLRVLEIQSGPTPTGPWTSRGKVEIEATSEKEFYRLGIY